MYVSGRTPPRTAAIPNVQARKASAFGPFSFVERKTASPKLPASQVGEIVKAVMRDPRIVGAMAALGVKRADVEKLAVQKLAKLSTPAKLGASVRIRELERKLAAEPNPVQQVEIRRRIAFAKLEGDSK